MTHLKYFATGLAVVALVLLTSWGMASAFARWPFQTGLFVGLALMVPLAYALGRTIYDADGKRRGKP